MEHQIKVATVEDQESILALLPRLAEFQVPKHRAPRDLWRGDAKMVKQWAIGERPELDVWVALSLSGGSVNTASTAITSEPEMANESTIESTTERTTESTSEASLLDSGEPTGAYTAPKTSMAKEESSKRKVIGVSIVSYKPELLSSKPSAHLEVIVVDKDVEGQGVATDLMKHAQKMAASNGAQSMSLHVFAANENARKFYDKHGFDGELLRYSKPLKVKKIHNFFGKHVATSGVARSIKKLLRTS